MVLNKEQLEKLLFVGISRDENLLALLGDKFSPKIFIEESLQQVSNFYYKFYNNFSRLPKEEEVKLFYSYEQYKSYYEPVQQILTNINYDEVDKSLLYAEFEKFIKERSALLVLNDIVDNISNKKKDALEPASLVQRFEAVSNISLCDLHVFDLQSDVGKYFKEVSDSDKRLSTGYKEIDQLTNGGILADGKFVGVIFGETNMGKSIMLTNFATNAVRQGKNALIISLELSEILYATRTYADLYDLPISQINFLQEELNQKISAHPNYGKLYVKEFPPGTVTVEQVSGFIENLLRKGYHFDLVCVDYLTLLSAPKADNSNEAGKELTRKLRALTYKFNFPIMTAAQLNREGFDSVPSNKNAAEAIAIPQECDFAIGIYQQKEDKEQNIMRVKCTKSRLGTNDWTIQLRYNRENLRFEDISTTETGYSDNSTPVNNVSLTNLLQTISSTDSLPSNSK